MIESKRLKDFVEDINLVYDKLCLDVNLYVRSSLERLRDRLISLYMHRLVKINHSVMELTIAKELLLKGYSVDVEFLLDDLISCDVYGVKGDGTMIVEVETGYVPPLHALDPTRYLKARIVSKISRYSNYSEKFCLAFPLYYLPDVNGIFFVPPRFREKKQLDEVKVLCDYYYKSPPVSLDEIRNARLHSLYIIDVDSAQAYEMDLETYKEVFNIYSNYVSRI